MRQNNAASAEVKYYSSGDLSLPVHADAPRNIYIEARNERGDTFKISATLQSALAAQNFKIVDNPSEAGYILHINLLQEGPVNQDVFERLVRAGYGSKAVFTGNGAEGLLVDALLVQRRVPSEKRPERAKLKNISTRNAIESAQMRLGTIIPRKVSDHASAREALSINLARALRNALSEENVAAK